MKVLCGNGCLSEAEGLLHKLRDEGLTPDVISYNTLISAYMQYRSVDKTLELYDEMKGLAVEPNISTYYTLISMRSIEGKTQEVVKLCHQMLQMNARLLLCSKRWQRGACLLMR